MSGPHALRGALIALSMLMLSSCASEDGYSGYGGGADVTMSVGYYSGGYYPYYPYYPAYPCCWYGDDGRPIEVPPGERPDRPTTLPGQPSQLPAERPASPTTRPAPAARPAPSAPRPATRPTPAPRPMGGGRRR